MSKDMLDELIDGLAQEFKDMAKADEDGDEDLREIRRMEIRFAISRYAGEV